MTGNVAKAVAAREAATTRVRRLTVSLVAAGAGLAALFTALAAGATHVRKVVPRAHAAVPARAAPVHAPTPPLVAVRAPSTPSPPPAPAPAPAPAAPPVVVSGGS